MRYLLLAIAFSLIASVNAADEKPTIEKLIGVWRTTDESKGKSLTVTLSKDGKCTLEKIPAGDYNLSSNLKGTGNARKKVSVKAGETLSVELSLKPRETAPAK